MQNMRNKTLRRKVNLRIATPTTDAEKLRILRALYIQVYNSDLSVYPLVTELFHALGEILEGVPADSLDLCQIDKDTFVKTYADLSRNDDN